MPMYNAGQMIRELRRRKKISQEILCEGLCEPPTLSKIECCRQNPTKKLFEALMSRLGSSAIAFNIPVTTAEFIRGQIEREVASSFANSKASLAFSATNSPVHFFADSDEKKPTIADTANTAATATAIAIL